MLVSRELEASLVQATVEACDRAHAEVTLEHMALALTENPSAMAMMASCGARFEFVRSVLIVNLALKPQQKAGGRPAIPHASLAHHRVMQRALMRVRAKGSCWNGGEQVMGADALEALLVEAGSSAVTCLGRCGVTLEGLREAARAGLAARRASGLPGGALRPSRA